MDRNVPILLFCSNPVRCNTCHIHYYIDMQHCLYTAQVSKGNLPYVYKGAFFLFKYTCSFSSWRLGPDPRTDGTSDSNISQTPPPPPSWVVGVEGRDIHRDILIGAGWWGKRCTTVRPGEKKRKKKVERRPVPKSPQALKQQFVWEFQQAFVFLINCTAIGTQLLIRW